MEDRGEKDRIRRPANLSADTLKESAPHIPSELPARPQRQPLLAWYGSLSRRPNLNRRDTREDRCTS